MGAVPDVEKHTRRDHEREQEDVSRHCGNARHHDGRASRPATRVRMRSTPSRPTIARTNSRLNSGGNRIPARATPPARFFASCTPLGDPLHRAESENISVTTSLPGRLWLAPRAASRRPLVGAPAMRYLRDEKIVTAAGVRLNSKSVRSSTIWNAVPNLDMALCARERSVG